MNHKDSAERSSKDGVEDICDAEIKARVRTLESILVLVDNDEDEGDHCGGTEQSWSDDHKANGRKEEEEEDSSAWNPNDHRHEGKQPIPLISSQGKSTIKKDSSKQGAECDNGKATQKRASTLLEPAPPATLLQRPSRQPINQQQQPGAFALSPAGEMTYNERIPPSLVGSNDTSSTAGSPPQHPPVLDVENPTTSGSIPYPNTSNLAVANLVAQDEEEEMELGRPTTTAQPAEDRRKSKARRHTEKLRKRLLILAGGMLLVVLVVAIVLSVLFSQTNNKSSRSKDSTTSHSTPSVPVISTNTSSPSLAPQASLRHAVLDLLPVYSVAAIQEDPESAQSLALRFILEDPNSKEYPVWRLLQRYALATIYYATGGDKWRNNEGWLDHSQHECQWFARKPALYYFNSTGHILDTAAFELSNYSNPCEEPDLHEINLNENNVTMIGKYYHLSLASNKLYGTLPPQIGLLTSLKTINLDYASRHWQEEHENGEEGADRAALGGSLPSEIGSCTDLEVLALIFNQFSGTLPSSMARLTSLWHLGLWSNQLNGSIPTWIGALTNLRVEMSLRENNFTGTIPSQVGSLSKLEWMKFKNNSLEGSLPTNIAQMTSLQSLWLGQNSLSGPIPSQVGILSSKLEEIGLLENGLSGTVPTQLGTLSSLRWFGVNDNTLTGTVPTEIGILSNLQWLELNGNQLTGTVPELLHPRGLPNLEELLLQDNLLTGSFPNNMASLITNGSLVGLRLHGNLLTGRVNPTLCSIGKFNISGDSLYGPGLSFDCSEQLCGCHWCPCAADDGRNQIDTGGS